MVKKGFNKEAIKRAADRSAKASMKLERRIVPDNHVRSPKVEQFLANKRKTA
ncbi:MAG: hypothetical protein QM632_00795 [Micrococcaceae bacterium]